MSDGGIVRPSSIRDRPNPLHSFMNLTSTGMRHTNAEESLAATKAHLQTLVSGGKLDRIGHSYDSHDRIQNPRSAALIGSFRGASAGGSGVESVAANSQRILPLPEQKSGGIVYTDAKRWYKPPPGVAEIVPKKLRLAPTARPKSAPDIQFIPLSQRRFPDLNLPFSTVEQNPTANYVAIHSAMAHNVNNTQPNPLAASKAASRAAYFQSSSIAANAAVAGAVKPSTSTSAAIADQKSLPLSVSGTRLQSPKPAAGGKGGAAPAANGEVFGDSHDNSVPTRVNYKRRSFIARNFFHQEGVFESQSGVTNAYQYFRGTRPYGGRPQTHQTSRTTISGYPFDMYTKQA